MRSESRTTTGSSMFRNTVHHLSTALAVLAFGLSSCGGTDSETIQGAWALETATVEGEPYTLPPPEFVPDIDGVLTLARFEADGSFWVDGPCNTFNGQYEFDGQVLILDDYQRTAMYCLPPGSDPEGPDDPTLMDAEEVIFAPLSAGTINVTFTSTEPESMQWTEGDIVLTFRRSTED